MQRNRESNFPLVLFITVEAPCSRRFQHEQEMLLALNGFITITQQKRTLKSLWENSILALDNNKC